MIKIFSDGEALAQGAANLFAEQARKRLAAHGRFSVLLAGGETPRRTYQLLAQEPYRSSLPWDAIDFFWGDERCVPSSDPRSNAGMVQRELLQYLPLKGEQIHPINCAGSPQEAADAYQLELITAFAGAPPIFDFVLLGLGEDGHTASLLPGSAALSEKKRWTAVTRRPEEAFSRITLTLPILNQAALILFLVSGRSKARVLAEIINGSAATTPNPARLIQPQSGDLRWFVEKATTGQLSR